MASKRLDPKNVRRRAKGRLLQKVQHAVPGIVLLQEGIHGLQTGAHGWHLALAIAEIATSALVFLTLIRAVRTMTAQMKGGGVPHPHYGIDWVDIFLGLMLFTEAWAKYQHNGHISRPTLLLAVVMIALGLFFGKLVKYRDEKALRPQG
jgi:hypothetical protein